MTDSDLPVISDAIPAKSSTLTAPDSDVKQNPHDVPPPEVQKPYSIFSRQEKWFIVSVVSFAGIFSPFTANIYFPAIPAIVSAFHKSTELINLTVTVYMVVQAISPLCWSTISDRLGRRPIFLLCMLILTLTCVGLALTPTNAYWLLMLLRCVQAAGSASTIALGAGVIGDISTAEERGGFFGLYGVGPMLGPSIGPIIGGGLSQSLGWRSLFWFLCIASGLGMVFIFLFLPETLRALVGDGSITPSIIYRPVIPLVGRDRADFSTKRPPPKPFVNPLRLLTYPDLLILLVINGLLYAVCYGVTASLSTLFKEAYPFLNETDLGLCFLGIGVGSIIGSLLMGKFLDRDYKAIRDQMLLKTTTDPEKPVDQQEVVCGEDFPIEKARLRTVPIYIAIFTACCIGYGWCIQAKVSLAGPLILQFLIGYVTVSIMNTTQTLMVDLVPSQSSSVTACNNLIRCGLGAAIVSVIDIIIKALSPGWTYVLLGGISALTIPLVYLELWVGPRCRVMRRERRKATSFTIGP